MRETETHRERGWRVVVDWLRPEGAKLRIKKREERNRKRKSPIS
jgi:hypothetical protein